MSDEVNQIVPYRSHWLLYGDSGSGKSTSAATFPAPQLVMAWDPIGKEYPYKKYWLAQPGTSLVVERNVEYIIDEQKRVLCQIEHLSEDDPRKPQTYSRFMTRMDSFGKEMDEWRTGTLIIDSVTAMELCARKWAQYALNPSTKEPRQWYSASTEMLEEMLMMRLGALDMNVVVICHIDEHKNEVNGEIVRNPAAPGRLSKRLASGFAEQYRQYVMRDAKTGERIHAWQTHNDGQWNCATQLELPDPCEPTYQAIEPAMRVAKAEGR